MEPFLNMTQRVELFFSVTQRVEFFLNTTHRIEIFFWNVTQRIEPFFSQHHPKNWTLFTKGLKELDFFQKKNTQRIELFEDFFDSKNYFLWLERWNFFNLNPRNKPFFQLLLKNDWPSFLHDSQNWTLFITWLTELNPFFITWLTELNPF